MRIYFKKFMDSRGNVSMLFAISAVVLMVVAGGAVDWGRQVSWAAKIQAVADEAALGAAANGGSNDDMEGAVKKYFTANFGTSGELEDLKVNVSSSGTALTVSATAQMSTSFIGIAGINSLAIAAQSEVPLGTRNLEISMVLDASGSMNAYLGSGSRMATLKAAAKSLVNIVSNNGSNMSTTKFSVVPFNMGVNIGTDNSAYVQGTGNALFSSQAWAGCVMERAGSDAYSDSYDGSTSSKGKWYAFAWPPEPNSNSYACSNRSNGSNTGYQRVDAPSGNYAFTRGPNYNCIRHSLMRLSNNYSGVMSKLDSLTAEYNDGTILAPGFGWGLRTLSPNGPFGDGAKYTDSNTQKVLIILTDGEQTTEAEYGVQGACASSTNSPTAYSFNPASFGLPGKSLANKGPKDTFSPYGYILDSDPFGTYPGNWSDVGSNLYNVSKSACNTVKTAGGSNPVVVYTILVSADAGPGTTTYKLMQECASSASNFFVATDAAQLTAAFQNIANSIKLVRLSK